MPIFLVYQCAECRTFQSGQQKKNTNKFECKLCHVKQSIRKVFQESDSASDLRPIVQRLNELRGEQEQFVFRGAVDENEGDDSFYPEESPDLAYSAPVEPVARPSRWAQFLEEEPSEEPGDLKENQAEFVVEIPLMTRTITSFDTGFEARSRNPKTRRSEHSSWESAKKASSHTSTRPRPTDQSLRPIDQKARPHASVPTTRQPTPPVHRPAPVPVPKPAAPNRWAAFLDSEDQVGKRKENTDNYFLGLSMYQNGLRVGEMIEA